MYLISSDSFRTRVDLVLSLSLKTALIYKSSMSYVSPQSLSSTQDLTSTNATNPRSIADVAALSNLSNVTFDFSAVISINDQDVKDLTQYDSGFQDLDAMYNNVLDTPATTDGTLGAFLGRYFMRPGDTTSLKFENGSYTQSTLQLQLIGLSWETSLGVENDISTLWPRRPVQYRFRLLLYSPLYRLPLLPRPLCPLFTHPPL